MSLFWQYTSDLQYFQKSIFVIWISAFVIGAIPTSVSVDVYDRNRSLPNAASKWAHCAANPSRQEHKFQAKFTFHIMYLIKE